LGISWERVSAVDEQAIYLEATPNDRLPFHGYTLESDRLTRKERPHVILKKSAV
jgi:hypothetical protein